MLATIRRGGQALLGLKNRPFLVTSQDELSWLAVGYTYITPCPAIYMNQQQPLCCIAGYPFYTDECTHLYT